MKNPRHVNTENGILLDYDESGQSSVYVEEIGPFSDLWQKAISGEFGVVAAYTPPTPEQQAEILAMQLRSHRNDLLSSSDWTQLLDIPESTREVWADYRQALRDIPQQEGFPHTVNWPEKPNG